MKGICRIKNKTSITLTKSIGLTKASCKRCSSIIRWFWMHFLKLKSTMIFCCYSSIFSIISTTFWKTWHWQKNIFLMILVLDFRYQNAAQNDCTMMKESVHGKPDWNHERCLVANDESHLMSIRPKCNKRWSKPDA